MRNPFRKQKVIADPDRDPIAITHAQDPSLAEDEMVIYTTIDTSNLKPKKEKK